MQQQGNSQHCTLLHTVRNQNNKHVLHLTFFIMTRSKFVKYVFVRKRITATCKLQNIHKEGSKSKQQIYPTLKIVYHDL